MEWGLKSNRNYDNELLILDLAVDDFMEMGIAYICKNVNLCYAFS